MKTEDLISSLSEKNTPAPEIRPPFARFVLWLLAALFSVGAGIAVFGLRHDHGDLLSDPVHIAQSIFSMLLAASSALSAFFLSVPDRSRRWTTVVPAGGAFLWLIAIVVSLYGTEHADGGLGFSCVRDILVLAAPPGLVLFIMLRRAAPLRPGKVSLFAALAVAALGALGTQFICTNDDPLHILIWHYVPVFVVGWFGVALGHKILKWRSINGSP